MTGLRTPRILDASALVELFSGHSTLMRLIDDANAGSPVVVVPTLAIAEAQAAIDAPSQHWERVLSVPALRILDLSAPVAIEVGRIAGPRLRNHPVQAPLIGPLMTAQVLYEAKMLSAAIVTTVPEAYGGHDVAVQPLD
ncbi:hypothetical protein [Actinoplanes flavus]|uniref:PIN domain-containing protein n=1 Tax=Actinoplanes flavus TaxID=2820290 RepID=A0ABS3UT41_9ACTN|nr:hypothetical protein [Actinoplanes flavus]MBO3741734.1 hypothetical protein [Actinoplanes flavus]